jgi:orotate phosphoribosyltransferase
MSRDLTLPASAGKSERPAHLPEGAWPSSASLELLKVALRRNPSVSPIIPTVERPSVNPLRRERLRVLLATKALREAAEGQVFTLSSGRTSDYYMDTKLVTQDPEGISLVAEAFYNIIQNYDVEAVGGPVQGAVPIATAVSMFSFTNGNAIPAFFIRGNAKEHGTMKFIEGPMENVHRVAIVDDVITSGRSVVDALAKIGNRHRLEVKVVVALVDRLSGGRELIEQQGWHYEHVFTIDEIRAAPAYTHRA